jgi:glutamyl-tRNA reductase
MNLFCVGISHHTANVERRERFVGHAAIDRRLREEVGCTEALLLTTCNRVEVYAASENPVPTGRIVQCLLATGLTPEANEFNFTGVKRSSACGTFSVSPRGSTDGHRRD